MTKKSDYCQLEHLGYWYDVPAKVWMRHDTPVPQEELPSLLATDPSATRKLQMTNRAFFRDCVAPIADTQKGIPLVDVYVAWARYVGRSPPRICTGGYVPHAFRSCLYQRGYRRDICYGIMLLTPDAPAPIPPTLRRIRERPVPLHISPMHRAIQLARLGYRYNPYTNIWCMAKTGMEVTEDDILDACPTILRAWWEIHAKTVKTAPELCIEAWCRHAGVRCGDGSAVLRSLYDRYVADTGYADKSWMGRGRFSRALCTYLGAEKCRTGIIVGVVWDDTNK